MAEYPDKVEFLSMPLCGAYTWQNKSIEGVACVYFKNMLRIQSLGRLPILLSGSAWQYATYEMVARHQLQLALNDPRLDHESDFFDPGFYLLKEEIRRRQQGEWFALSKTGAVKNGMQVGEDVLSMFAGTQEAELSEGLEAVRISMVTGMWTTFEIMAEDLWKAAIKERPLLGQGWTEKEEKKTGHRSMWKIINLYKITFRQDATTILETLGDERIEGLALTRNLLAHKLGKIDPDFDGKRGPNIPCLDCFKAFQLHDTVQLSGPIVQHLISPIPVLGLDLIRHVDQWITTHP